MKGKKSAINSRKYLNDQASRVHCACLRCFVVAETEEEEQEEEKK